MDHIADDNRPPAISLHRLFLKFLGFGLLAFGGPVAQIAMLRQALVEEERGSTASASISCSRFCKCFPDRKHMNYAFISASLRGGVLVAFWRDWDSCCPASA